MQPRTRRGFRRSDNLHLQRPAPCDQVRDDRDGDVRDRRVSLPSWTTRWARSCASSSPSSAFALMRSMIPSPSRRAASSTSESRLPSLAARTLTWRIRPSSIASVVFTRAISPYYHLAGEMLYKGRSSTGLANSSVAGSDRWLRPLANHSRYGAVGRRFKLRQVRVRLARMQPVLDFDRVRRQRGSCTALTAPGLLRQAKGTE